MKINIYIILLIPCLIFIFYSSTGDVSISFLKNEHNSDIGLNSQNVPPNAINDDLHIKNKESLIKNHAEKNSDLYGNPESQLAFIQNIQSSIKGGSEKKYTFTNKKVYNILDSSYYYIIISKEQGKDIISNISTYGDFKSNGKLKIGRVRDVLDKKWTYYPPITLEKSFDIIKNYMHDSKYDVIYNGLSTTDNWTQSYAFKTDSGIFLVNAESGSIEKYSETIKEEDVNNIIFLENGLLKIKDGVDKTMSDIEYKKLLLDTEESNKKIKDGLLKFKSNNLNDYILLK